MFMHQRMGQEFTRFQLQKRTEILRNRKHRAFAIQRTDESQFDARGHRH